MWNIEKMAKVCELTGVSEIIESFTEGMDHILSAGGIDLSDKTVIIISHREKFEKFVDKVYRIEGGILC